MLKNGNATVNCHASSLPIHPSSLTQRNTIGPPTLSSVLLWSNRAPSLTGEGRLDARGCRMRAGARAGQGRTRSKPTGRQRFLSPCVGACGVRADAREAVNPPDFPPLRGDHATRERKRRAKSGGGLRQQRRHARRQKVAESTEEVVGRAPLRRRCGPRPRGRR